MYSYLNLYDLNTKIVAQRIKHALMQPIIIIDLHASDGVVSICNPVNECRINECTTDDCTHNLILITHGLVVNRRTLMAILNDLNCYLDGHLSSR